MDLLRRLGLFLIVIGLTFYPPFELTRVIVVNIIHKVPMTPPTPLVSFIGEIITFWALYFANVWLMWKLVDYFERQRDHPLGH